MANRDPTTANTKTWGFVIHNPKQEDRDWCNLISDDVNRIVVADEVGDNTGHLHLQGDITFKTSKRLSALKKLHPTATWTPTKVCDSALYCKKVNGKIIIDRRNTSQGDRTDLEKATDAIKEGMSLRDLWQEHSTVMVKYSKGMEKMMQELRPMHTRPKYKLSDFLPWQPVELEGTAHVWYGAPHCGKTQFALAHFKRPLLVRHMDTLKRFRCHYHDGIVFDDMSFTHWHVTQQIALLDWEEDSDVHARYECAYIPAGTIKIFTCNDPNIFNLDPAFGALRRITFKEFEPRSYQ